MNENDKKSAVEAEVIDEFPQAGKPLWLGTIGMLDPNLAVTLLQCGKVAPDGYVDAGGWEMINLVGRWTSTAADQNVKGQINGMVTSDMWIRKVMYTVRRPNAFAGNVFKAQSDYYNAKNPNIDFQLTINSYCRYLISPEFSPLENIEMAFECVCPVGLVLRCSANINAYFINLREFATDENPTEAIITMHGTRLPMEYYGQCNAEQSRALLRELKYLP